MRTRDLWTIAYQKEFRGYFLLIVATYISILFSKSFSLLTIIILLGLGILYTLTGLFGHEYCLHTSSRLIVLAFFIEQIALSGAILYLSGGGTGFLLFTPLAAYGVILLHRHAVMPLCMLLLLLLVGIEWKIGASWQSILVLALSILSSFVFVIVFTLALNDEARARSELSVAHQRLGEYATQVEELATMAERNRLAREIHDSVGHYLTTINMQLEVARVILAEHPEQARDSIEKAQTLAREGLGQIRASVAALRTLPTEKRALPEVLAELVQTAQSTDSPIALHIHGTWPQLSSPAKFALYRIAQEGLTNASKHAHAAHIDLILDATDTDTLKLSVKDDGIGTLSTTGGFGLLGARERIQALGGQIRTTSAPGAGFLLEVELAR